GQLMTQSDLDLLRSDIGKGRLKSWEAVHARYNELWEKYPLDKQKHAFATLAGLHGEESLTRAHWNKALKRAVTIQEFISDQVYLSRQKDYTNRFRMATFRNSEEMTAALGTIDENSFIIQVRDETEELRKVVEKISGR
ncbi:MAG: DUF4954 family protein, partial [Bacteroidales bacterium]|nr:DUF4954 family protein [Bacteroidales bacterium]